MSSSFTRTNTIQTIALAYKDGQKFLQEALLVQRASLVSCVLLYELTRTRGGDRGGARSGDEKYDLTSTRKLR